MLPRAERVWGHCVWSIARLCSLRSWTVALGSHAATYSYPHLELMVSWARRVGWEASHAPHGLDASVSGGAESIGSARGEVDRSAESGESEPDPAHRLAVVCRVRRVRARFFACCLVGGLVRRGHVLLHWVPVAVSSMTIPASASSSRMRSASVKSRASRARVRCASIMLTSAATVVSVL